MLKSDGFWQTQRHLVRVELLLESSFPSYLIDIVWSLHNLFMTIMMMMMMMMRRRRRRIMMTIITLLTCSDDISHSTQSHIYYIRLFSLQTKIPLPIHDPNPTRSGPSQLASVVQTANRSEAPGNGAIVESQKVWPNRAPTGQQWRLQECYFRIIITQTPQDDAAPTEL